MNDMILNLSLLQVGLPLVLIAANTLIPSASRLGLALRTTALLTLLQYSALTGLWLFPPWWTPYVLMGLLILGAVFRWQRIAGRARILLRWAEPLLASLVLIAAGFALLPAYAGRDVPADSIDLAMPLGPGRYLVTSGGTSQAVNAHMIPLPAAHAASFRGQTYALDVIGIDQLGLYAGGISPVDPTAYVIYGTPVLAPCDGQVAQVIDGIANMPVPQMDRANMTGNSVMLACDDYVVLLAHLAPDSITVSQGQQIVTGTPLGAVGNTGNTGAPHLHMHVQQGMPPDDPLAAAPLWFTLDGAFYVRNNRFEVLKDDRR